MSIRRLVSPRFSAPLLLTCQRRAVSVMYGGVLSLFSVVAEVAGSSASALFLLISWTSLDLGSLVVLGRRRSGGLVGLSLVLVDLLDLS